MVTDENWVIPLVIVNREGSLLGAALINAKGLRKSLEQEALWVLHSDTGKLLPYDEKGESPRLLHLERRGSYAVATLETARTESTIEVDNESAGTESSRDVDSGAISPEDAIGRLVGVIRQRKEQQPEGSYTTYLFREGAAKIRKKTGEEAIEVILSKDSAELTSEAADLIYHLLVLLEFEGVPWSDVLDELSRRGR